MVTENVIVKLFSAVHSKTVKMIWNKTVWQGDINSTFLEHTEQENKKMCDCHNKNGLN
jgi:hypothetical protein